jgi:hypothetical protein
VIPLKIAPLKPKRLRARTIAPSLMFGVFVLHWLFFETEGNPVPLLADRRRIDSSTFTYQRHCHSDRVPLGMCYQNGDAFDSIHGLVPLGQIEGRAIFWY